MNTLFSLHGRNVLLTGATGMLGKAYAHILYHAGADLILVDVDKEALAQLSEDLQRTTTTAGNGIELVVCDLRDRSGTDQALLPVIGDKVDILINNAALTGKTMKNMARTDDVSTCPEDVWDASMEVNVTALFRITKHVLPGMIARGHGNVINISSIYGNVGPDPSLYEGLPLSASLPYSVTKAAVLNFTRYVANLHGRQGIRCNTLTLGGVRSEVTSDAFVERYSARTALGRMAAPDDYQGAMLFLCSDASLYMTGANLIIDGGWTAR